MNEIGYFRSFWLFIWSYIKQSFLYRLLRGVYDRISASWRGSGITGFFRREHFSPETLDGSAAGRVLRLPFTFFAYLQRTVGARLSRAVDESRLVHAAGVYLNAFLAVNTRFIGALTASGGICAAVVLALKGGFVILPVAIAVIGVIIALSNYNLTAFLKSSAAVNAVIHLSGIETEYRLFDKRLAADPSRTRVAVIIGGIAGLLAYINPLLPPLAVIGLLGLFLIMASPLAGVYVSVFAAPLLPTMAMVGLALLSLISLLFRSVTDRRFKWRFDGMGFLIMGMLIMYLFSSLNSFAVINSLSIFLVYMAFMLFYFVVINTVRTRKQLFNALTLFVISGAAVCLYGVAQYIFGWDVASAWMDEEMFTDIKMRVYSTLENPNVLGEYILLVLPVCAALMWQKQKKLSKLTYAAVALLMAATLILTFSRGCWIGCIITAGIFVTFVCGKLWGLALIVLPFLPMVIPESIINRFVSVGDMKDSSTSYRVYIWFGTFAMLKDFWASGIGPGTEAFKSVYPFYSYSGIVAPHSHNMFLQIFVESGIVGIFIFIALLFVFIKKMIGGYQHTDGKGSALGTMIVAIAAGVIGFAVQGMFDNCFYNYRVFMIFWYVLALGIAAVYIAGNEREAVRQG